MLDGAAVLTGIDTLNADTPVDNAEVVDALINQTPDDQDSPSVQNETLLLSLQEQSGYSSNELIFIDSNVDNYQVLLAAIEPSAEVILLDSSQDGMKQIADAMEFRVGVSAIHIISHGGEGTLQLGNTSLTSESITGKHADDLAALSAALSEQADILIYGCNFGAGEAGAAATSALAAITGADIAASDDLTGDTDQGGDWELEVQQGNIEANMALDAADLDDWQHTLETVVDISGPQVGSHTVTEDGQVTITITGGDGGDEDGATGGQGATVTGTFAVTAGEEIHFVAGEAGQSNVSDEAGGGGSTGVYIGDATNGWRLVMVAGAGGGGEASADGQGGQATTAGGDDNGNSFAGGVNGTGGTTGASAGGGGGVGNPLGNANGAGQNGSSNTRGSGLTDIDPSDGLTLALGGTTNADGGDGFTAGGAGSGGEAGGGGGYSGGGAGGTDNNTDGGGGGGSFLDTADASFISGNITAGGDGAGTRSDGTVLIDFERDTDGDGIFDDDDLDDDNDGITDEDEIAASFEDVSTTVTFDAGLSTDGTNIVLTDGTVTITITNDVNAVLSGSSVTFNSTGGLPDSINITATSGHDIIGVTFTDIDNMDPDNDSGNAYIDAIALDQAGTWSGINGAGQLNSYTPDSAGETAAAADINANAGSFGGAGGRTVDFSELTTAGAVSDILINPDDVNQNNYTASYTFDTTTNTFRLFGDDVVEADNQITTLNFVTMDISYRVGADTDGDGVIDQRDLDSDNDGISDLRESGLDAATLDTNNDGELDDMDGVDGDLDDDGLSDAIEATYGADQGITPVDTDNDGTADYLDLDSDNDGIADTVEARPTAGYTANDGDVTDDDTDGDGVIDQFDSDPAFGGTFSTPNDHDGDGTADYLDNDSDNDGILDVAESGIAATTDATYADPDGSVNDPATGLSTSADGGSGDVDFRDNDLTAVDDVNSTDQNTAIVNAPSCSG